MKFFQLVLAVCVTGITVQGVSPSTNWGQVHPIIDPDIPSYVSQTSVSGKLTLSASEAMKPLVQAWVGDLIRRHPDLDVAVMVENSKTGLFPLFERRVDVAVMSRRITPTEISDFILEHGYQPLEIPVARTALATFVHGGIPTAETFHPQLIEEHGSTQRGLYLYIVRCPKMFPTPASIELVRYALSRQGQQLALNLGHLPLSFEEVRQVTSRWSASLQ